MLSDSECSLIWSSKGKDSPIVLGTPVGDQVMKWLDRKNREDRKQSANNKWQYSSFTSFKSPVDGKMINNSQDLSNHNRQHGVEQVGHEYEKIVEQNHINNNLKKA